MEIALDRYQFMLERMFKIRHFEDRVRVLFAAGELPGFVHLYLGEEAIASGVCAALNDSDYITSTHRGHGHILAKGGEMKCMMAELYGRATGYNKGKGGSMHIAYPTLGILGANGIVGAGMPIATGAALSAKVRKSGQVAACFFGDGASNEGTFHESLNLASAFSLPVVFVCENNLYAVGTPQKDVRKVEDIADRAVGYAMPGVVVDGNDVIAVYEAAVQAVERARTGGGPTLIECKTYRWRTHFEGEPDTYRPPEELKAWMDREPIQPYCQKLVAQGILTAAEIEQMEQAVVRELDAAVEFARQSPFPEPETALQDLWA
ncbi:MAG: thiamine pyrophosphate-dependent dehydrogenase E1 component subunit alpha [Chloroflexi bacterium]|nr:thiamine pyrophosphate-dependent dehydrogenase E1 component subunit alpha [Anaerolineaceae bacterium]NMB90397.1 thiamine pyrophosphate-dependent dehydrogenase E1 component subunit alpha [Chloroflexota bacterium]